MFLRREGDVRDQASSSHVGDAIRRARRRQLRTAAVAALAAVAVIAPSIVALSRLLPLRNDGQPISPDGGPVRTAIVPYLAITYPRDWVLTVWSDPASLNATIQLTNFDPDVRANAVCFSKNQTMPPAGVLLHIEVGSGVTGEGSPTWPQELEPNLLGKPELCGVHGEQLGVFWASDDGSISYDAHALIGPGTSPQDRDRLLAAFHSLSFKNLFGGINVGSPEGAVVLSSGEVEQTPWVMTAFPDQTQPGTTLDIELGAGPDGDRGGLRGSGIGGVVVDSPDETWISSPVMAGNTMLFGAVAPTVARVQVRPEGADPFDAELNDPPTSLGAALRTFIAPMSGTPRGTIVTFDAAGDIVHQVAFTPDGYSSPKIESPETPEGVIATGKASGHEWRLFDTGSAIYLQEDLTVLATAARAPDPAISFGRYTFDDGSGDTQTIVFGVASTDVTEVVLFTSGLPGATQLELLGGGNQQIYWQSYSPGALEGQVIALDRNCNVLQAIDLATGKAPERVPSTSCG